MRSSSRYDREKHISRSDVMGNIAAFGERLKKETDIGSILNELLQHERKLHQLGQGDDDAASVHPRGIAAPSA